MSDYKSIYGNLEYAPNPVHFASLMLWVLNHAFLQRRAFMINPMWRVVFYPIFGRTTNIYLRLMEQTFMQQSTTFSFLWKIWPLLEVVDSVKLYLYGIYFASFSRWSLFGVHFKCDSRKDLWWGYFPTKYTLLFEHQWEPNGQQPPIAVCLTRSNVR